MINDELLAKFERIQDLPVSEEMLGAYMEGNVDSCEASQIESVISDDSALSEFVDSISHDSGFILDNLEQQIFDPTYPHFLSDIQLPSPGIEIEPENFYQDYMMAAGYPGDRFNSLAPPLSDKTVSSDSLFEKNITFEDSFLGADHSLDIDSQEECDDMFNNDSNDI